jgi:hypothetical protein
VAVYQCCSPRGLLTSTAKPKSPTLAASQAEWVAQLHGVDGTPAWLVDGRLINGLRPRSECQQVARRAVRVHS